MPPLTSNWPVVFLILVTFILVIILYVLWFTGDQNDSELYLEDGLLKWNDIIIATIDKNMIPKTEGQDSPGLVINHDGKLSFAEDSTGIYETQDGLVKWNDNIIAIVAPEMIPLDGNDSVLVVTQNGKMGLANDSLNLNITSPFLGVHELRII
jgi:hypothetical protein